MISPVNEELRQGDGVRLHGQIVNLRNGVARVQVCRQLIYCLTDELEREETTVPEVADKAVNAPPETRAMAGPPKSKGTR